MCTYLCFCESNHKPTRMGVSSIPVIPAALSVQDSESVVRAHLSCTTHRSGESFRSAHLSRNNNTFSSEGLTGLLRHELAWVYDIHAFRFSILQCTTTSRTILPLERGDRVMVRCRPRVLMLSHLHIDSAPPAPPYALYSFRKARLP